MKKYTLLIIIIIFFTGHLSAWCIAGRGSTCDKNKRKTNVVNIDSDGRVQREDGGAKNKREKGDKSENQGYAKYKEHFVYYSYVFLAIPHQQANRSANTNNRSFGYEYAFNPFISVKGERTELYYESFIADSVYKNIYTYALLNLRIYIFNKVVLRSGIGYGISDIKRESNDEIESNKSNDKIESGERYSGNINVVQMSLYYIWGDENTMIGINSTTVEGRQGDQENLGSTFYALSLSVGF